jgi:hypothetical protein
MNAELSLAVEKGTVPQSTGTLGPPVCAAAHISASSRSINAAPAVAHADASDFVRQRTHTHTRRSTRCSSHPIPCCVRYDQRSWLTLHAHQDALDTMVLGVANLELCDAYKQTEYTPFDPTLKRTGATLEEIATGRVRACDQLQAKPQVEVEAGAVYGAMGCACSSAKARSWCSAWRRGRECSGGVLRCCALRSVQSSRRQSH